MIVFDFVFILILTFQFCFEFVSDFWCASQFWFWLFSFVLKLVSGLLPSPENVFYVLSCVAKNDLGWWPRRGLCSAVFDFAKKTIWASWLCSELVPALGPLTIGCDGNFDACLDFGSDFLVLAWNKLLGYDLRPRMCSGFGTPSRIICRDSVTRSYSTISPLRHLGAFRSATTARRLRL